MRRAFHGNYPFDVFSLDLTTPQLHLYYLLHRPRRKKDANMLTPLPDLGPSSSSPRRFGMNEHLPSPAVEEEGAAAVFLLHCLMAVASISTRIWTKDALKRKFTRRELRHRHGHTSTPSAWAFRAMKRLSIGTIQLHFFPPVLPEQIFG